MDKQQLQQSLRKYLPASRLSTSVFIFLLCLIAYQLAGLTWQLIPRESANFSWKPTPTSTAQPSKGLDLVPLKKEHLFGQFEAKLNAKPAKNRNSSVNAPKTKLKLDLSGLVYSSDQQRALAIIIHRNEELSYAVGESIKGTKAKVKEILIDRVILDNQGQRESLFLDSDAKAKSRNSGNSRSTRKVPPPQDPRGQGGNASSKLQAALKDPAKLSDLIRYSVVREDNKLLGYRVNPGKDRQLFEQVGLKPGDLAVALNGYDLRDNAQAMQIMKDLNELSEITVTVERDGQLEDIFFALPEE